MTSHHAGLHARPQALGCCLRHLPRSTCRVGSALEATGRAARRASDEGSWPPAVRCCVRTTCALGPCSGNHVETGAEEAPAVIQERRRRRASVQAAAAARGFATCTPRIAAGLSGRSAHYLQAMARRFFDVDSSLRSSWRVFRQLVDAGLLAAADTPSPLLGKSLKVASKRAVKASASSQANTAASCGGPIVGCGRPGASRTRRRRGRARELC